MASTASSRCFSRRTACYASHTSALNEHYTYLSDTLRTEMWRQAFQQAMPAGAVVVDLGSGTGVLGLLALRAGAAKVYAIEAGPVIDIARAIARENGFDDRIVFLRGMSTQLDLPEQADVLIADQIGYFGFNAGAFGFYADACRRFLKPGGVVFPHSVTLLCSPVESAADYKRPDFWRHSPAGFSMQAAFHDAVNTPLPTSNLTPAAFLAEPIQSEPLPLNPPPEGLVRMAGDFRISRDATLHGLAGFFSAEITPGVSITNSPLAAARINRAASFLPIDTPVQVRAGDTVSVNVMVRPLEMLVNWTVRVNGEVFRHSTFNSIPAEAFGARTAKRP